MDTSDSFETLLSFKGKTSTISLTAQSTVQEIDDYAREAFQLGQDGVALKLLWKGKVLGSATRQDGPAFPGGNPSKSNKKPARIMVMASSPESVVELNTGRSDPTIRGFDTEKKPPSNDDVPSIWGDIGRQDRNYKFCRFQACTWQSFGHRAGTKTPHAFEAMKLLQKLATDPGVVAIMVERELVVGTLGEMDPIDDVLKQKKEAQGVCLLGYNTNQGTRIDLKLRTADLQGFLPYHKIVGTLIHELSHNWVGEHNAVFWSNFGQMRVEYLHRHASLAASGHVVNGKTTPQLAGMAVIPASSNKDGMMKSIADTVIGECSKEMAQHGIPVQVVVPAIHARCRELMVDFEQSEQGQRLGGGERSEGSNVDQPTKPSNPRELALVAAERRAREKQKESEERRKS